MRFFPRLNLLWFLEAVFGLAALVVLIILGQASKGSHAPLPYLYMALLQTGQQLYARFVENWR